jgi:hypothetical protein
MRRMLATLTLFGIAICIGVATAQEIQMLDLTAPRSHSSTVRNGMRVFTSRVVTDSSNAPRGWPLRATLVSVAREEGNRLKVDMRLEALQTVTVPISSDLNSVDPDPRAPLPSFREMIPQLQLDGATAGEALSITQAGLFGSDLKPGSLLTLQPGQSVRVRYITYADAILAKASKGKPTRVRAVMLTIEGSEYHPDLYSDNTLAIE